MFPDYIDESEWYDENEILNDLLEGPLDVDSETVDALIQGQNSHTVSSKYNLHTAYLVQSTTTETFDEETLILNEDSSPYNSGERGLARIFGRSKFGVGPEDGEDNRVRTQYIQFRTVDRQHEAIPPKTTSFPETVLESESYTLETGPIAYKAVPSEHLEADLDADLTEFDPEDNDLEYFSSVTERRGS